MVARDNGTLSDIHVKVVMRGTPQNCASPVGAINEPCAAGTGMPGFV